MDLTRPAATLLSRVDSAVLAVLFRSAHPLTVREVQRLVDSGSYEGVRLALRKLTHSGLLDVDERTSGTFYLLNREHVAFPAVEALFTMRQRLTQQVAETIANWPHPPLHASFFGSYVRREGDVESDIDVLVIFDDKVYANENRWTEEVGSLERAIRRWSGNTATVLTMSARDLRAMASGKRATGLWKSMSTESVLVYGTELGKLSR
ncbi:MAG: nucleotidyltransferase domain-containing protein [Actinomycetota bacterium]